MKNFRIEPTSKHSPDYQDGSSLTTNQIYTQWVTPFTDELAQLNNFFNNPNCKTIAVGERRGGNPGFNNAGNELNAYSYYEWHSIFPRPVVIENTPSDASTWFRALANVSTRDYTYTAYISTRYPRSFLLNGHFLILEPTYNLNGELIGGMRMSVQTIRRKNLALWEVVLEQQSDNKEVFGYDGNIHDTSEKIFAWGGNTDYETHVQ
jgi:hypothetical protein